MSFKYYVFILCTSIPTSAVASAEMKSMSVNADASLSVTKMRREASVARKNHAGIDDISCQRLKEGLKMIQTAPKEKLRDTAYLENVIRMIGLTPATDADTAQQWYGDEMTNALPGALDENQPIGLFQIPQQLACFLVKASHWGVNTMLETGTWSGWTSVVLAAYLGRFAASGRAQLYTVDIVDRLTPCIKQAQMELGVQFYKHDSTKLDELHDLPETIDLCFFDADHSAACVDGEMNSIGGRCRTKAFHDIVNFLVPEDYRAVWEKLKDDNRGRAEECTYQPSGAGPPWNAMGYAFPLMQNEWGQLKYEMGLDTLRNQMMGFGIITNTTS